MVFSVLCLEALLLIPSFGLTNTFALWITLAAIMLFGVAISPCYYIPMSVFSVDFGGVRCGVLVGIIDAVGYSFAMAFDFIGGAVADRADGWSQQSLGLREGHPRAEEKRAGHSQVPPHRQFRRSRVVSRRWHHIPPQEAQRTNTTLSAWRSCGSSASLRCARCAARICRRGQSSCSRTRCAAGLCFIVATARAMTNHSARCLCKIVKS